MVIRLATAIVDWKDLPTKNNKARAPISCSAHFVIVLIINLFVRRWLTGLIESQQHILILHIITLIIRRRESCVFCGRLLRKHIRIEQDTFQSRLTTLLSMKHSIWLLQVKWLVLTNQIVLFPSIYTAIKLLSDMDSVSLEGYKLYENQYLIRVFFWKSANIVHSKIA